MEEIRQYTMYEDPPVRPEDQATEIGRVMDLAAMDEGDPRVLKALANVTNLEAKYALQAAIDQARAALTRTGQGRSTLSM